MGTREAVAAGVESILSEAGRTDRAGSIQPGTAPDAGGAERGAGCVFDHDPAEAVAVAVRAIVEQGWDAERAVSVHDPRALRQEPERILAAGRTAIREYRHTAGGRERGAPGWGDRARTGTT